MSWDTDSYCSGLSSPRSTSPSPFSTPLTPVGSDAGFGKMTDPDPDFPGQRGLTANSEAYLHLPESPISRNNRRQASDIELPIRPKKQSPSGGVENSLEEIKKRRDSFFAGNRGIILPLLSGGRYVCRNILSGEIRPYQSIKCQPAGIKATLKPYQLEGLSFLLWLRENGVGGILGDEMGLGKTLQILALFQHLHESNEFSLQNSAPFLVVCPLSVVDSWISEVSKWAPNLTVLKYHGTQEDRRTLKATIARQRRIRSGGLPDIVVTSYDTVVFDVVWFRRAFVWEYIVLDEGHRIKNSDSKTAQILDKIPALYKLVLSGTPVQNNLHELWAIFHWLYPDVFDETTAAPFEDAFSLNEGIVDVQFLESCRRLLDRIMLRRLKDSPGIGLSLPPKTEIALSVPLSQFQHAWYLKILTGVDLPLTHFECPEPESPRSDDHVSGESFESEDDIDRLVDQTRKAELQQRRKSMGNILMELRKCSIHPYLLDGAHFGHDESVITSSGKFVVLHKIIQKYVIEERKKLIVFSNFDHALTLCEDLLTTFQSNRQRFEHARLDGRTSSAWRRLLVHLFSNDPRYMVLLVSIRAGGEGLNLTSSSVVVFLDEDWNPQVMRQAEARVHRIGQKHPVSIFKLYSRGTVEEQINRRLAKKAYLASMVTENYHQPFSNSFELVDANLLTSFARENVAFSDHNVQSQQIKSWKLETIIQECRAHNNENRGAASPDGEKSWLERAERIRTNIFNGTTIDTTTRGFSIYKEQVGLSRAERRIGKKRVVMIEGFEVTKENLALSQMEDATSEGIDSTKSIFDDESEMTYDAPCFLCKNPDANECRLCPRAFHQKCLERICPSYDTGTLNFLCPHHYCFNCERAASQVGRLLFCCQSCVKAYCEQCLDWQKTTFIGKDAGDGETGVCSSSFFVRCALCVGLSRKRSAVGADLVLTKSKRVKA